jgi:hypothetical protein
VPIACPMVQSDTGFTVTGGTAQVQADLGIAGQACLSYSFPS